MVKNMVSIILGLTSVVLFTFPNGALAAPAFPEKPITLIAWSTPGGGSDTTCRMTARIGQKHFPKPLVVLNKPGGGGKTGMKYLLSLPNDGYNVLLITSSIAEALNLGSKELTPEDFDYVIRLVEDPMILAVTTTSKNPIQSWKDLVEKAQKKPGMQKWGGSFFGSKSHILSHLTSNKSGIKVSNVPFEGSTEAVVALLGNHIDVFVGNPRELIGHVEAGKAKFIANFATKRLTEFPDVPTLQELGVNVTGNHWRGFVVKKGTPPEIVRTLHDGFKKMMSEPEWIDFIKKSGLEEGYLPPKDFLELTKKETQQIKEALVEIGFK